MTFVRIAGRAAERCAMDYGCELMLAEPRGI
jgi:hypothetical protein